MSQFEYYTISFEEGMYGKVRGNIGKKALFKHKDGSSGMNMMLFLIPNGDNKNQETQKIVNAVFPEEALKDLEEYSTGDYVWVHFDQYTFKKSVSEETEEIKSYESARAVNIKMIRKAEKKEKETVKPKRKAWG